MMYGIDTGTCISINLPFIFFKIINYVLKKLQKIMKTAQAAVAILKQMPKPYIHPIKYSIYCHI